MRARARRRGFSIIEVLVALAILAAGAVSVLAIRSQAIAQAADCQSTADAMRLARKVLAGLRLQPRLGAARSDATDEDFPGLRYGVRIGPIETTPAMQVESATVTVWTGVGNSRRLLCVLECVLPES